MTPAATEPGAAEGDPVSERLRQIMKSQIEGQELLVTPDELTHIELLIVITFPGIRGALL
jgi:hypothetical protein